MAFAYGVRRHGMVETTEILRFAQNDCAPMLFDMP